MPKVSYERLDRSTGWFDPAECGQRFDGVMKSKGGQSWREVLFRTADSIWILLSAHHDGTFPEFRFTEHMML